MRDTLLAALLAGAITFVGWPADKKKQEKEEPPTQVLELPKEPPPAVVADTSRLVFLVAPMTSKGLLSQQVRQGIRALFRQAKGAQILRLRAFVAGTGDTRRVNMIVSEIFTQRHRPLPAVTTVQVGALPQVGAQVALEAMAESRKPSNPNGLAFLSAQATQENGLPARMVPLIHKSIPKLLHVLHEAGLEGQDVVRATCFLSSLQDAGEVRNAVWSAFPKAVLNFVQPERDPFHATAACEAVARLRAPPAGRAVAVKGPGSSEAQSDAVLVNAPRVVLAGGQIAFGSRQDDLRLALERMGKTLDQRHSSLDQVAAASFYALSGPIGARAEKIAAEFFNRSTPPANAVLTCVGLPALDASFALDVVAVISNSQ